ncbi:MAG TPA: enoyl-CoA hydratase-related protein [Burkholderiales bacterium]|nr:enoyl-CoA hydratase-related protein [Burkholderiales bacterium]
MVEIEKDGALARIFLNRPQKANALNSALLDALGNAIESLVDDDALHAVLLAGRGRAFCGGADLHELEALDEASARTFIRRIHEVCAALRRLPIPVVAQLHGAVIGAGLELAAACDLRVAAEGTRFAMPEVRLGIPSVVEAALLPRLVGTGRAAWLVLTGEAIDARRACEWGLVEEIAPSAQAVVRSLLAGDRAALMAQKQLLQLWEEAPLSSSIAASVELFARLAGR